jgi:alanine racemase
VTATANCPTAEINLTAIKHNLGIARAASPNSKVMAVIKADAYGHGLVQVGQALESADALGVARLGEAVQLREAGIKKRITLLEGVIDASEVALAKQLKLDLVVHSMYQSSFLKFESGLKLWLKLETGMNRLGLSSDELESVLAELEGHEVLGVMGHLANADESVASAIDHQLAAFEKITSDYTFDRGLANSAALLAHPRTHFEWNRPGLMLYGASPFKDLIPLSELKPAMTLTAPIIAIKRLEKGDSVGYGGHWLAGKRCLIAVVGIGYGDGYPREVASDAQVFINGSRRKLVGRVSMDMMTIELADGDDFQIGSQVELWGENLPIEMVAEYADTIPYTLMCGVTNRVQRRYRN